MQDTMTDLNVRVEVNKMAIESKFIFDLFTLSSILSIMCWEFSTPTAHRAVQVEHPKIFITVMCTDTYDSTTYDKRIDVKTACTNTVEACTEASENSCPKGLTPLNIWITDD